MDKLNSHEKKIPQLNQKQSSSLIGRVRSYFSNPENENLEYIDDNSSLNNDGTHEYHNPILGLDGYNKKN